MTLLFDENLSPRLPLLLSTEFPNSIHVRDIGMRGTSDEKIWTYCLEHNFAIISKDTDFLNRGMASRKPPKIIWLDVGNAGTAEILELLRREMQSIESFREQEDRSTLILSIS
jgi:predicted nuclease of predicted toxin-antitoxin system